MNLCALFDLSILNYFLCNLQYRPCVTYVTTIHTEVSSQAVNGVKYKLAVGKYVYLRNIFCVRIYLNVYNNKNRVNNHRYSSYHQLPGNYTKKSFDCESMEI